MAAIKYRIEKIPKTWLDEMLHPGKQFEQYTIQGGNENKSPASFRKSRYFKDVYIVDAKTSEHLSIKQIEFAYPELYTFLIKNVDIFVFVMPEKPTGSVMVSLDDFTSHILPQMIQEE